MIFTKNKKIKELKNAIDLAEKEKDVLWEIQNNCEKIYGILLDSSKINSLKKLEEVKAEIKKTFKEVKSLESIQNLETWQLLQLIELIKKESIRFDIALAENTLLWKQMKKNEKIQEMLRKQTITLEKIFRMALAEYTKLVKKIIKEKNFNELKNASNWIGLKKLFNYAMQIINEVEMPQVDNEIEKMKTELIQLEKS